MSQKLIDPIDRQPDDTITLHPLCEEDFPWLLLWMTKESPPQLILLLETSRGIKEIILLTALLNKLARVSLLVFYEAIYTQLRMPHPLEPHDFSIQQLQLNPLLNKYPELRQTLVSHYLIWLYDNRQVGRVVWEIDNKEILQQELAIQAGFRIVPEYQHPSHTLYLYTGTKPQL